MFPLEDVRVFELHTTTPDAADKHPKRSKTAPSRDGPDNKDKSTVIIQSLKPPHNSAKPNALMPFIPHSQREKAGTVSADTKPPSTPSDHR